MNLTNLHFIKADAIEFISCIPADLKILNCYVISRSLAQSTTSRPDKSILFELLSKNVRMHLQKLFFKTDHIDYYKWASHEIENSSFWKLISPFWPHQADSFFQDLLPHRITSYVQKHTETFSFK